MKIDLELQEINILFSLLNRTTLQGSEVQGYVNLIQKIQKQVREQNKPQIVKEIKQEKK